MRIGGEAPPLFQRFAQYQPGNQRVVEFNVMSQSVRLKSTPEVLQGKTVEYAKTGPKVVVVRRGRGRPRKYPVGAADTRTGAVGKKSAVKVEETSSEIETEVDDGSESELTDLEMEDEGDSEVGDSQE